MSELFEVDIFAIGYIQQIGIEIDAAGRGCLNGKGTKQVDYQYCNALFHINIVTVCKGPGLNCLPHGCDDRQPFKKKAALTPGQARFLYSEG
ncbi:hypothetical protein [Aeromonas sp. FDAARGOS 1403]|uniref:hypothetical protein n=1 Tax=Aeromonas TaxID=642 RepID=UPI0020B19098|nr:hypothetical protein [Aeromonas sp. FDAARGOS 1403]